MSPDTKQNTKSKTGSSNFLKFPIDEVAVGHAGLYHSPPEENETAPEVEQEDSVTADIPLGMTSGGNTVINSESGIKAFVKDELAGNKENNLPNTETGVWIHYLTQGIRNDFKRTWEQEPKSIRKKVEATKKDRAQGKRVITKKEKNELLAKLEMSYYQEAINEQQITLEDAFASMKAAFEQKTKLEESGYYLSPKRTEGLMLFDAATYVNKQHNDKNASKLYSSNKIQIIIPNIWKNYYSIPEQERPAKLNTDVSKCKLLLPTVAHLLPREFGNMDFDIDGVDTDITSLDKLHIFLFGTINDVMKQIDKKCNVLDYHLIQRRYLGEMKPRFLAIDTVTKKGNKHEVYIADGDGGLQTLKSMSSI